MTGADPGVSAPVALSPEDFDWESLGLDAEADVRTVIGPERSRSLGAGFARFRDATFDWSLGYDEVLHVLEGHLFVEHGEGTAEAAVGDVLLLPRGNTVKYRFVGKCTVFFATYPVDWPERTDG